MGFFSVHFTLPYGPFSNNYDLGVGSSCMNTSNFEQSSVQTQTWQIGHAHWNLIAQALCGLGIWELLSN